MKKEIYKTSDGSNTLYIPEWDESYHSKHGAIQEAYHVYIKNGLLLLNANEISILEIGLGTGLNTLITLIESEIKKIKIDYTAIEAYPISLETALAMNYVNELKVNKYEEAFINIHNSKWGCKTKIYKDFYLTKEELFFQDINYFNCFDLIYFDAFGYRVQPELWSKEILQKMYDALKENGYLVTYCAKGLVKRTLEEIGFFVQKVPGPPGKREMIISLKKV